MAYNLKVKIIDTYPKIPDERQDLNEQTVVIELPDGKQIGLFNTMPIVQDMIGQMMDISIVVGPKINGIKIVDDTKPGIEPSSNNPHGYRDHKYSGIIREIGVKDKWHPVMGYLYLVSICVGSFNVLVDFDKNLYNIISEGDKVEVKGAMSNLLYQGEVVE